jgi:SAM-dependent methyltransferase
MTVLDFGAGRGNAFVDGDSSYCEMLTKIQGKVQKVVGVDVDDAILEHPFLDEKLIIDQNDNVIPVKDQSTDLILAHWVFEHIQDPDQLASEFFRILKPGGYVCARTPHRWGHVGIFARLTPKRIHHTVLRWFDPAFNEIDRFPAVYRLNSGRAISKYFDRTRWSNYTYGFNSTPRYHFENLGLFALFSVYQKILWPKTDLVVILQKRADVSAKSKI